MECKTDIVIVGAGISGISAATYLKKKCPNKKFIILEKRSSIGGTWDLFKYPGIRSDSDMFTLGFSFKPWKERKAIANGPAIMNYLKETVDERKIDSHISYNQSLIKAEWSSKESSWKLTIKNTATNGDEIIFCKDFNYVSRSTPKGIHLSLERLTKLIKWY